jgi:hypothetical protein
MVLDANESERLWRTLGLLNAQVESLELRIGELTLELRRIERGFRQESRHVARRSGGKTALAISAVVAIASAVSSYFTARSGSHVDVPGQSR